MIEMKDLANVPKLSPLSPEERKLPVSKYYDIPVYEMGPLYQQILKNGPLDPKDCIKAENWLDHLKCNPGEYGEAVVGYCTMPDGYGYLANYCVYPESSTPEMMKWYFSWINSYCKSQPRENGNIRYKLWLPIDHIAHLFVNGKDKTDGIATIERLDMGTGKYPDTWYTVRYANDLRALGLSEEREKELNAAGVWVDSATEKFYSVEDPSIQLPGSHLHLTMSRPHPLGGMEKFTKEWIGWGAETGELYFDDTTPKYQFTEDWLESIIRHATIEAQHLAMFLPQLYNEYHDKPIDAD